MEGLAKPFQREINKIFIGIPVRIRNESTTKLLAKNLVPPLLSSSSSLLSYTPEFFNPEISVFDIPSSLFVISPCKDLLMYT